MSNTLSVYDPIFYAQEALIALEKALGLAGRVFRGYDDDQSGREKGSIISIRVPGAFTAQNAPSTAQDISASEVQIALSQHKEVKFQLTDKELAYTSQRIIEEHIRPAAYAIADNIDQALAGLVDDVPWFIDLTSPAGVADVTSARRVLFDNKVTLSDEDKVHFMVSGVIEKELLDLQAFAQFQGAGQTGADTQQRGYLGKRYGFNFFANQNTPSRTSQTLADASGTVVGAVAIGLKAVPVTALSFSLTPGVKRGDIIQFTGHTQQYVATADANTDGAGATTLNIYGSPLVQGGGLEAALTNGQVVTVVPAGGSGATKVMNVAFHQNAFALAMAKLPDFMDGQGVRVFSTPVDPASRLAVRARTWADPNNSKFLVALDVLYGVKTLDGNKAVRARD